MLAFSAGSPKSATPGRQKPQRLNGGFDVFQLLGKPQGRVQKAAYLVGACELLVPLPRLGGGRVPSRVLLLKRQPEIISSRIHASRDIRIVPRRQYGLIPRRASASSPTFGSMTCSPSVQKAAVGDDPILIRRRPDRAPLLPRGPIFRNPGYLVLGPNC